jgi:cytochrome c oxidase subunit 2
MHRKISLLFLAVLIVVSLAACGSSNKKADAPKTKSESTQPASTQPTPKTSDQKNTTEEIKPTGKTVEITVTAKSFEFDKKEIDVQAGDQVVIHLVNADGAHGFAIDEFGVNLKGGETATFVANKKGEFQYYCSLMCGVGHDKMIGKLVVQ